ncbi:hypothetical protein GCM10017612_00530 [Novosphingobium resinovorum]|nr:hypothetical protein GCM10017612_00530 [Novosphingobium resinovorum]
MRDRHTPGPLQGGAKSVAWTIISVEMRWLIVNECGQLKIGLDQFELTGHESCVNPRWADKALRGVGFNVKKPAKWGKNSKSSSVRLPFRIVVGWADC